MAKKSSTTPSAREVFRHALRFLTADQMLRHAAISEQSNVIQTIMFPAMVLSSLSSELFFKCLILGEGTNPESTHNLLRLYNQLSTSTQDIVKTNWNSAVLQNEDEFKRNENTLNVTIPRDLDSALADCGDAFKLMRYLYEEPNAKFYIIDLPDVLHNSVRALHPDW